MPACINRSKKSYFMVRPLLVESLVIVIFYMMFLMHYAVIINYRTNSKGKINLETKYNMI